MTAAVYVLIGYLSGSILFARLSALLFQKPDLLVNSPDQNPGTANAFQYGGFQCGIFTLAGDVLKGFLPVFLYHSQVPTRESMLLMALVLAAPVLGHTFPIFYHFHGGKGIAVSFGCLLGLLPLWKPAAILAALFILFSVVIVIRPNFYRTYATYLCAIPAMALLVEQLEIKLGFLLMACCVFCRLHMSKEKREEMKVQLLWKH